MITKSKIARFVDNGLFVSFARHLAPSFKKFQYCNASWISPMPQSSRMRVGDGFDEMEHVLYPLSNPDEVDLWIIPDLYHPDLQCYLESQGCRVFGARYGEELELDRVAFKKYLNKTGLPVGNFVEIEGIEALRNHLKEVRNKYVKTDIRGDFETFRHDTFELSEPRLDEIAHLLGPVKRDYCFVVEDEITNAVEVGYDGISVDGKWPTHCMLGYEIKDMGFVGVVKEYSQMPEPVRFVNERLSAALKGYKYRGFLSTEIRYTKDKKPYLIDPCCRLGSPSNELLQELFDNWAEVIWHAAEGELVPLRPKSKFAVAAVINSEWATNDWQAIHFPKDVAPFVKLRFHTRINDKDYVVPQVIGIPDIGYVVGVGNTLKEAEALCRERAEQIKGHGIKCELGALDKALGVIREGEKVGIRFS